MTEKVRIRSGRKQPASEAKFHPPKTRSPRRRPPERDRGHVVAVRSVERRQRQRGSFHSLSLSNVCWAGSAAAGRKNHRDTSCRRLRPKREILLRRQIRRSEHLLPATSRRPKQRQSLDFARHFTRPCCRRPALNCLHFTSRFTAHDAIGRHAPTAPVGRSTCCLQNR